MTGDCRLLKQALNVLHFAPCAGHILDLPPPPAPSPRSNGGGDADATDAPPTAAPGGDTEATGKLPVLSAGDWMRRGMLAERLGAGLGDGAKGQAALAYSCCCRCVNGGEVKGGGGGLGDWPRLALRWRTVAAAGA